MTEPSIRVAGEADAPAIAWLHLASYRAAYRGLLPEPFLADFDIRERERRWRDRLRDPARTTFLVEDVAASAAAPIAFAEVGPCREADGTVRTGELLALHVAEGHWRQGIGSLLHRHAIQSLAARRFESVTLWVLRDNARARAFYEAVGWVRHGRERHRVLRGLDVFEVAYRLALGG